MKLGIVLMATTDQFTEHAIVADELQTCLFRSLGQRSATFGWYMEYKACLLVHL